MPALVRASAPSSKYFLKESKSRTKCTTNMLTPFCACDSPTVAGTAEGPDEGAVGDDEAGGVDAQATEQMTLQRASAPLRRGNPSNVFARAIMGRSVVRSGNSGNRTTMTFES